jgi:hypothetical protein
MEHTLRKSSTTGPNANAINNILKASTEDKNSYILVLG